MKIAISADHRGAAAARALETILQREGHEVQLVNIHDDKPCDYPETAFQVGNLVAEGAAERGILICGTGIGMSIAANKVHGVRAAVVQDELTAELSRSHNDANIVCLSGDLLGQRLMEKIVHVFMRTPFEGGRHARRIRKIEAIEKGDQPDSIAE